MGTLNDQIGAYKRANNRLKSKIINQCGQIRSMRLRLYRIRQGIDYILGHPYSNGILPKRRPNKKRKKR